MTETRSAQSLEYLIVPVSATDEDGATVDPTGDSVAMAFVTEGDPLVTGTTFIAAAWETNDSDPTAPIYSARLLVGPAPDGAYVPVAGARLDVWLRVTDSPEVPKIRAGTIRFT